MSAEQRRALYTRAFGRAKCIASASGKALEWHDANPEQELFSAAGYAAFAASINDLSARTIAAYMRSVRAAWKWAWREGRAQALPEDLPSHAVGKADRQPREVEMPIELVQHYTRRLKAALGTQGTACLLGVSEAQVSRAGAGQSTYSSEVLDGLERVFVAVMVSELGITAEEVARVERTARREMLRTLAARATEQAVTA